MRGVLEAETPVPLLEPAEPGSTERYWTNPLRNLDRRAGDEGRAVGPRHLDEDVVAALVLRNDEGVVRHSAAQHGRVAHRADRGRVLDDLLPLRVQHEDVEGRLVHLVRRVPEDGARALARQAREGDPDVRDLLGAGAHVVARVGADRAGVAHVAQAVPVRVELIGVRCRLAIVAGIAQAIAVAVGLVADARDARLGRAIRSVEAVVAGVAHAVTVGIRSLAPAGDRRAGVAGVPHAVVVAVGLVADARDARLGRAVRRVV